ncbi:MAG TPA: 1,2-phenylacetyl-CoA epoxidase subunit PaaD [Casimicrobiaceae bacterium]|nr:1,2-phenylacetyl-CoA epoxidase subunit PaaD [Casimicrobiaceae bacterium]
MTTAEQRAVAAATEEADRAALRAGERPALAAIWQALGRVPDPEIPVVSVVELGIVREVAWRGDRLHVRVTPTYSGCPATDLIMQGIGEALEACGVVAYDVQTVLAPAWTTDWIAPEAKAKLRAFGIAPPGAVAARIDVTGISPLRRAREAIACPRCGSTGTSLLAQFGSTACKALYRCEACREPFDYFKPH